MGHGLVTHRNQNYLTNAVKVLLEGEFLKGVANPGNRKGALEMVEKASTIWLLSWFLRFRE
jgi:hypothetical protein